MAPKKAKKAAEAGKCEACGRGLRGHRPASCRALHGFRWDPAARRWVCLAAGCQEYVNAFGRELDMMDAHWVNAHPGRRPGEAAEEEVAAEAVEEARPGPAFVLRLRGDGGPCPGDGAVQVAEAPVPVAAPPAQAAPAPQPPPEAGGGLVRFLATILDALTRPNFFFVALLVAIPAGATCKADNDPTGEAAGKVQQSPTFYELDLGLNHVVRKYAEPLAEFGNLLVSVPGGNDGPSGVLVFCENYIVYKNVGDQPDIRCPIPRRRNDLDDPDRGMLIVCAAFQVSSTTYHLLADDGISFKTKADHELRRAELQDIKRMQKEESRQLQEMSLHAQMMRDAAEKKAESERAAVMRTFDANLEALTRAQKRQLEETEKAQEEELNGAAKKAARAADIDAHLRRIQETKKAHVALMERQFLQEKHQLMRAKEAAQWELEEKQMKEGHQLDREQMKDAFFLQRTLLLTKHASELDQIKRFNAAKLDECERVMAAERKRLPKVLRSETKTRSLMFKKQLRERLESLRISGATDGMEMSERIRAFEEQEKRRVAAELRKQEAKHKRKLDQIKAEQERSLREHEHVQNEKRRMLLEHEGRKLKEQELGYSEGLKAWKGNLKPRKTALEATFLKELESQEEFYAQDPTAALLHNAALAGSRGDLSAM